ncbi:MAG TPA: hypothetical protein V6D17_11845 [Candidatus Obscuribacterales bacterium]
MQWGKILITELIFTIVVLMGLGFIRLPRFLMRRRLSRRFPWGYYPDQVPQGDPYMFRDRDTNDFLHDTGTEFGGLDGFGDYGEFSGFGELGEYGQSFFGGDGGAMGGE